MSVFVCGKYSLGIFFLSFFYRLDFIHDFLFDLVFWLDFAFGFLILLILNLIYDFFYYFFIFKIAFLLFCLGLSFFHFNLNHFPLDLLRLKKIFIKQVIILQIDITNFFCNHLKYQKHIDENVNEEKGIIDPAYLILQNLRRYPESKHCYHI